MSHSPDRLFFRLALIGALVASLGLAACGRKGALDPPPSTVSATGKQKPDDAAAIRSPFEKPGDKAQSSADNQVPDKPIILDSLLN